MKFELTKGKVIKYKKEEKIYLVKDLWDDWYKYETKFLLKYVGTSGDVIEIGNVKIGQHEMKDGQKTPDLPETFTKLSSEFFSLGQGDYYYNNILKLGKAKSDEILKALNDIAFNNELYEKAKDTRVMNISLCRDVDEDDIRENFPRILDGKSRLTKYFFRYTYPDNGNNDQPSLFFKVEPNSNPPTNLHVIIGRNNVGKTYLIKNMINSIYRRKADDVRKFGRLVSSNDDEMDFTDYQYRKAQAFANVICIAFSPFDDFSGIETLASEKNSEMPYKYIGFPENTGKAKESIKEIEKTFEKDFIEYLMKCILDDHKHSMLKKAISTLETDVEFSKSNLSDLVMQPTIVFDEPKDFKVKAKSIFRFLSSGHKIVLLIITQLIDSLIEKSFVILDEPENYLHPPLISALIRAVSDLLIDRNAVGVISTHSPIVLQEVPKSCVYRLTRNGSSVNATRLDIETFGGSVNTLIREVFGLEVRQSGFHKMLIDEVSICDSYEVISSKFNNELGDEAKAMLRVLLLEKQGYEKN